MANPLDRIVKEVLESCNKNVADAQEAFSRDWPAIPDPMTTLFSKTIAAIGDANHAAALTNQRLKELETDNAAHLDRVCERISTDIADLKKQVTQPNQESA